MSLDIQFVADKSMTETVLIKQERKWSRRLKFEKWRRFDIVNVIEKPSSKMVFTEGKIFGHPDTIEKMVNKAFPR